MSEWTIFDHVKYSFKHLTPPSPTANARGPRVPPPGLTPVNAPDPDLVEGLPVVGVLEGVDGPGGAKGLTGKHNNNNHGEENKCSEERLGFSSELAVISGM